jgi:hypothetical protein
MMELKAKAFYTAISIILNAQGYIKAEREDPASEFHKEKKPSRVNLDSLREHLVDLNEALLVLHAASTKDQSDRLNRLLDDSEITWDVIFRKIEDLDLRLMDDLGRKKLFAMSDEDLRYYEPTAPLFGTDFSVKFQTNGAFELDEAAKCKAFGRPTAAAFHLMRVMEIAIQALAKCLGIPDPTRPVERNWGFILGEIWKGIEKRWPTAKDRMHGDGQLLEELYASLDAVKNPWRNGTMHVEKKYTDDEAEHILIAVRGFTKKLASRMDEDGKPLA